MIVVLVAIGLIAVAMLLMSVGVLFSGRCLRGSCGGPDVIGPDGESLLCATCPHRSERAESEGASQLQPLGRPGGG